MNFHMRTADFYAGVRMRLRGRPPVYGSDLLPRDQAKKRFFTYRLAHGVADPIPDQRRRLAHKVKCLSPAQQIIATRRALAAYARMRSQHPGSQSARLLRRAIAEAFKMDSEAVFGRNNRQATTVPRQIAMALLGPLTGFGRTRVGNLLNRDHSTVFYAAKKMAVLLDGGLSSQSGPNYDATMRASEAHSHE